jgi:restriction system protein
MAIPDFQSIMLPHLKVAGDGKEHSISEYIDKLVFHFSLTEQEINQLAPSGKQTTFYNRVAWARLYLSKSGLLEMSRRSFYRITEQGKQVLSSNPVRIDMKYLQQFPGYVEFKKGASERKTQPTSGDSPKETERKTPEEILEDAFQEIHFTLAQELLTLVKQSTPAFFERLVVELLVKMGYGGSWQEAARAVGQAGDEGIDGIIDQDRLGLDTIYIQAKKWENVVSRPEIQKFAGALEGKRSRKGVYITTSRFSNEAKNYVSTINSKIVLIDGQRLAELMIDFGIGVTEVTSYSVKRVDSDYFTN